MTQKPQGWGWAMDRNITTGVQVPLADSREWSTDYIHTQQY